MTLSMTPIVVLIICKTLLTAEPDPNEKWTGHQNREWATEHSMMQCRRLEIQVTDIEEVKGADRQPYNQPRCARAAIMLMGQWDRDHRGSAYRAWMTACPVPIKNHGKDGIKGNQDDETIGWKLPECGHRETVVCEVDSEI